jgi:glycine dehydrogenase subunit 2
MTADQRSTPTGRGTESKPLQDNRRKLLMERSVPGRVGTVLPAPDVPYQDLPKGSLLRETLDLPEVTEPEVVRYFTNLSLLNFSIDTHFYPLGSCTMKYNPKINDEVAFLPGFGAIHPNQTDDQVQGALKVMYRLQGYLTEITGMVASSLAPLAGAQGELSGILMIQKYHRERGEEHRRKILIPDSAHGTNPASASMAGFHVVSIPTNSQGNTDLEALKKEASSDLAGMMITLPSTLGLFDQGVLEICRIIHEAGGLIYADGANMNALLGQAKMGHLGFDVMHLNLHKTFSTPHGGGGPGAGPVCVQQSLVPYLPGPVVVERQVDGNQTYTLVTPEKSIGKVSAFHGNFGVLVRAYTYIRTLGNAGLRQVSENAVLNANYILHRLKEKYLVPFDRTCMHEVVFSANRQKERGVRGLEVAKRLLDYGFHAPTMYFPLTVEEALLVEPTETESKETLDLFIETMETIDRETTEDPELVKTAPHTTPVGRLDEARAARRPDLRWQRKAEEDANSR